MARSVEFLYWQSGIDVVATRVLGACWELCSSPSSTNPSSFKLDCLEEELSDRIDNLFSPSFGSLTDSYPACLKGFFMYRERFKRMAITHTTVKIFFRGAASWSADSLLDARIRVFRTDWWPALWRQTIEQIPMIWWRASRVFDSSMWLWILLCWFVISRPTKLRVQFANTRFFLPFKFFWLHQMSVIVKQFWVRIPAFEVARTVAAPNSSIVSKFLILMPFLRSLFAMMA